MTEARKIRAKTLIRPGGVTIRPGDIHWVRASLADSYIADDKAELVSIRSMCIPDDEEIFEDVTVSWQA
jgi:hypothetical protein